MRLKDQVALISGAGGPMGFAIARRMAEEGADLVITDISGSRLEAAVAELDALPDRRGHVLARRASVIVATEAATYESSFMTGEVMSVSGGIWPAI
jgi:NAD(P)-dependent dehydrogenase (short-subunit alcohol dehydrogenase family)